jgi:hypothetical protein
MFFFSFEFPYLRVPTKPLLGGPRKFGDQLSQKSLASRTFIVQNGPAWSRVTRCGIASDWAQIGRLSQLRGSLLARFLAVLGDLPLPMRCLLTLTQLCRVSPAYSDATDNV